MDQDIPSLMPAWEKLPVGWVFANISNDQLCCIGQKANVRLLN